VHRRETGDRRGGGRPRHRDGRLERQGGAEEPAVAVGFALFVVGRVAIGAEADVLDEVAAALEERGRGGGRFAACAGGGGSEQHETERGERAPGGVLGGGQVVAAQRARAHGRRETRRGGTGSVEGGCRLHWVVGNYETATNRMTAEPTRTATATLQRGREQSSSRMG